MCFKFFYWIYLGPIGRTMHNTALLNSRGPNKQPHLKWKATDYVPVYEVGNLKVLPVSYLDDNLAYIVFTKNLSGKLQLELLVDPGDFDMIRGCLANWQIEGTP